MAIIPTDDHVLLESAEEEKTASGFILATKEEKPTKGRVIAVGPGRWEEGKRIPIEVNIGDIVYFTKYMPDELDIIEDGKQKNYWIIREPSILAIDR